MLEMPTSIIAGHWKALRLDCGSNSTAEAAYATLHNPSDNV